MVVVAGAGYGKTTLLAEGLASLSIPGAWCSCDERLTGPGLLAHVSMALGECFPGFGTASIWRATWRIGSRRSATRS